VVGWKSDCRNPVCPLASDTNLLLYVSSFDIGWAELLGCLHILFSFLGGDIVAVSVWASITYS
jgi:hypothetical protein